MPPRPQAARSGSPSLAYGIVVVIFDLDGVIYRGQLTLPHAVETIRWLQEHALATRFLTNNSTKSRTHYVRRLRAIGIPCRGDDIMSSAYATALYLQEKGYRGARTFVVGERGLATELRQAGLEVVDDPHGRRVDLVVVGLDRRFNYHTLAAAQQAIFRGAKFIATNADNTFPAEEHILPGGGAVVAAIAAASGVRPVVVGKPKVYMIRKILQAEQVRPDQALMIGDRLDTDIAGARGLGWDSLLVLTGVTSAGDLASSDIRPTYVAEDLRALADGVLQ